MVKKETLGQFEQLVLLAVKTIENAYAVPVHVQVERNYGQAVKIASIYSALNRLEEKALCHLACSGSHAPTRQ